MNEEKLRLIDSEIGFDFFSINTLRKRKVDVDIFKKGNERNIKKGLLPASVSLNVFLLRG